MSMSMAPLPRGTPEGDQYNAEIEAFIPPESRPKPPTEQFTLREQLLNETSGATGVASAGNDAALLGVQSRRARERNLSRDLLG